MGRHSQHASRRLLTLSPGGRLRVSEDLHVLLRRIWAVSPTRMIRSAKKIMASPADRLWAIQEAFRTGIGEFENLPKNSNKKPFHHERWKTFFDWIGGACINSEIGYESETDPDRRDGCVHYLTSHLIFFMKLAQFKIPAGYVKGATRRFATGKCKRSDLKWSYNERLDMVLQGKWRQLYTELLNWHTYCKNHDLWQRRSRSVEGANDAKVTKLADQGQLSRAIAALDSTCVTKGTAEKILELHPPGNSMTDEDWRVAEARYNDSSEKWPPEPTQKMAHTIYYIITELDQHSAGSTSGLLNSDLTPVARQINTIDWEGKPGKPEHVLKHYPGIYGMIRLVYKIATNQLDSGGHCANALRSTKLVLIAKKPSGVRPIAVGETLRRIAGRFIVKWCKDSIIA